MPITSSGRSGTRTAGSRREVVAGARRGEEARPCDRGPTRAPEWLGITAAVPDQLGVDTLVEPPPGEHFLLICCLRE